MTKHPLFTATVDERGRITIDRHVRKRMGIKSGDDVEVYDMEAVK